jgi:UDP-N-acetylmuramate--alanine ligase
MEHIHFIGIGGTGLSAIATVLLEQGYQVSGSDINDSSLFVAVQQAGGTVSLGHQAENIAGADLIVRSSAIPESNVEVQAAIKAGIPVLKRSEFLGRMLAGKEVLAVAGSHGKTTTTSMLVWILTSLKLDPSFIVGGVVNNLATNARSGQGSQFVIEADEYDYMFWGLHPDWAVVTNVEHDHPDIFPTARSFHEAFEGFVKNIKPGGHLVVCAEDPGAVRLEAQLSSSQTLVKYGFNASGCDYRAKNLKVNSGAGTDFIICISEGGQEYNLPISLLIPGKHNVLNALAAFAVADGMGLDRQDIARVLGEFKGSERRFDIRGEFQGVLIVDDYAHHPTEISKTLEAARNAYPGKRIWAVWQPHTYSRTKALFEGFCGAFGNADRVLVLDVYPAREQKPEDFQISDLIACIKHDDVAHIPTIPEAVALLKTELQPADLLLVFTAGDAIEINDQIEDYLSAQTGSSRGDLL